MCLVREKWPLSDHRRCCCEFLCVPVNSGDSLTDVSQTFFEEVNLTKLIQLQEMAVNGHIWLKS